MKKRSSRKSLTLGGQPSFSWQVQDDPQVETPELERARVHRISRRAWTILASAAVVILCTGFLVGQRLYRRAEANVTQVESELAQAISIDNVRHRASINTPSAISTTTGLNIQNPNVRLLELDGSLAFVDVMDNPPREAWHTGPYRVARILRHDGDGWEPILPLNTFWRERRTLNTAYFLIDYGRRDQEAVRKVATSLDKLYVRMYTDLGLATPRKGRPVELRIAVVEGGDVRVTDLRYSGNIIFIPPPELIQRPREFSNEETLRQAIAYPLAIKVFNSATDVFDLPCQWHALGEGIGLWLRWEDHTLPSRGRWWYERNIEAWSNPQELPGLDDLLSIARDCWQPPPFLEVDPLNAARPIPRNELASTLIEYMVTLKGREVVSALMRDLDQYSDWETLARETVNLSADELEAGWHNYLIHRRP